MADTQPPAQTPSKATEIRTITGDKAPIMAATFHPTKDLAVSGGSRLDTTVRLFNFQTGAELKAFSGHTNTVVSVNFLGDSDKLLTASEDKTVRVWDINTGESLQIFKGHTKPLKVVRGLKDGVTVASAGCDLTVRIWSSETGEQLGGYEGHTRYVFSLVELPEGDLVATGGDDKVIHIFNAKTLKNVHKLEKHTYCVAQLSVAGKDQEFLISSGQDSLIGVWNWKTGELVRTLVGHTELLFGANPIGSTNWLLSMSFDMTTRLWNLNTGEGEILFDSPKEFGLRGITRRKDNYVLAGNTQLSIKLWTIKVE